MKFWEFFLKQGQVSVYRYKSNVIKTDLDAIEALKEFYNFIKQNPDNYFEKSACPLCRLHSVNCKECPWFEYYLEFPEEFLFQPEEIENLDSEYCACVNWNFSPQPYDFPFCYSKEKHKIFIDKSLERLEKMKKLLDKSR